MTDRAVHQRPCLPQNIAKEITLFTADLVHYLP
ncbi:Uncharacterised protein [Shigella sonnei]|nr:Uncharacterised protein [Shigella sonnei]